MIAAHAKPLDTVSTIMTRTRLHRQRSHAVAMERPLVGLNHTEVWAKSASGSSAASKVNDRGQVADNLLEEKVPAFDPSPTRPSYPHVVSRRGRLNLRWSIDFMSMRAEEQCASHPYQFEAAQVLDLRGHLTTEGRDVVLKRLVAEARRFGRPTCTVWSPHDCTWIDENGRTTNGNSPPTGQTAQTHLLDSFDAVLEDVWTLRLPDGCAASHLCIRRIGAALVEVTPGEPIVLGSFFDLPRNGEHDPAAAMTVRGRLKPPARFRGQTVTGVRDRLEVMGPVQPSSDGVILRNPWPDDLRRACETVAGRPLAERLHRAAWRALNPPDVAMNHVGVLKAA